jgi:hypothetical protein
MRQRRDLWRVTVSGAHIGYLVSLSFPASAWTQVNHQAVHPHRHRTATAAAAVAAADNGC